MKREDDHDRRDLIRQNRQRLRAAHQRRKLARIENVSIYAQIIHNYNSTFEDAGRLVADRPGDG